ncbi:MAG: SPOR domain-containing protein [Sphingobacteriaceae bacterium]|nr:SPOR domain-containing protein [Sphingobacteriaceae bacterium]
MGLFRKISLIILCFPLLTSCYSQGSGGNSIDANIPDKLAAYSTHTIEIAIKKGSNSSFSKYQLDVPPNVTIKEGISKDGNFSFEKQQAKLVWVESPKTDEFTITMIMEVGNATGQAMFEHRYFYIDGESRKEISDGPMHVEFTPGTPRDKTIAETKLIEPAKTNTVASTPTVANTTPTTAITKTEEPKKVNITIPVSKTITPTSTVVPVAAITPTNSSNTTPQSIEIKEYKVQIGSFGAKPSMAKYGNIGKVTVVEEAGIFKILAGSFPTKEEAIKKMEELKTQGHQGFVVLYINGVKAK